MGTDVPIAGLSEAVRWLLGLRQRVAVRGRSMLPTLPEGATVLVERGAPAAVGDVVLARHPYVRDLVLIKRVTALGPDGRAQLAGDNPVESSHAFGAVGAGALLGVVRSRLAS